LGAKPAANVAVEKTMPEKDSSPALVEADNSAEVTQLAVKAASDAITALHAAKDRAPPELRRAVHMRALQILTNAIGFQTDLLDIVEAGSDPF
jgi:hypothetical protein